MEALDKSTNWYIYKGKGKPDSREQSGKAEQSGEAKESANLLPDPPPWRDFTKLNLSKYKGEKYKPDDIEVEMVNAALHLRRPLLITGLPGTGKSSLAYSVASELKLGSVLRWNITSRTTLKDGLYFYDAIGRLQASNMKEPNDIGRFIRLGPLGIALATSTRETPRVLLIDEIDKSDIDFPNDLLNIFEEGEFLIPELFRLSEKEERVYVLSSDKNIRERTRIERGQVRCKEFPLIIMTSNGEREFPPAFNRRCLRLEQSNPDEKKLTKIIQSQLSLEDEDITKYDALINDFVKKQETGKVVAPDQLINAIFLISKLQSQNSTTEELKNLVDKLNLVKPLNETDTLND